MSRIANAPVEIPAGVEVALNGSEVSIKGTKGTLTRNIHNDVEVTQEGTSLKSSAVNNAKQSIAQAGTTRALLSNMVLGVTQGFEKKLTLVGVGLRQQQARKLISCNVFEVLHMDCLGAELIGSQIRWGADIS